MSRPTNDKKETTIILRVNEETKGRLEQEAFGNGISLSEYVRKILAGGSVIQNSEKPTGYVIPNEISAEIKGMSAFIGGSMDEVMRLFLEALTDGTITYDGEKYVGTDHSLSTDEFKEVCHDMGLDCQKVLDDATKKLRKGLL